jgi:hypothetical protein
MTRPPYSVTQDDSLPRHPCGCADVIRPVDHQTRPPWLIVAHHFCPIPPAKLLACPVRPHLAAVKWPRSATRHAGHGCSQRVFLGDQFGRHQIQASALLTDAALGAAGRPSACPLPQSIRQTRLPP